MTLLPLAELHAAVDARLRAHDVRYTTGRRRLVARLAAARGPRSAAELAADLGAGAPLSSLYRSLTALEAAGVVAPHLGARGVTRYELAEWLIGHHHHLVCTVCGAVSDVTVPPRAEARIAEVVAEVCAAAAFTPDSHVFEIEGRCTTCA